MSIWKDVEVTCEEFRTRLVELLGDHAGVHNVVNDAQSSLAVHVPEEVLQSKQLPESSVTAEETPTQAA